MDDTTARLAIFLIAINSFIIGATASHGKMGFGSWFLLVITIILMAQTMGHIHG